MTPKTKQEKMVKGAYKLFLTLVSIEPIPGNYTFPLVFVWGCLAILRLSAYSWLSLFATFTSNVLLFQQCWKKGAKA
jgi:hypothetical protein